MPSLQTEQMEWECNCPICSASVVGDPLKFAIGKCNCGVCLEIKYVKKYGKNSKAIMGDRTTCKCTYCLCERAYTMKGLFVRNLPPPDSGCVCKPCRIFWNQPTKQTQFKTS